MKNKLPPPPTFDKPEDEDEFWQTHSPLDFAHEAIGIPEGRQFVRPQGKLIVQLSSEEHALLKCIADKRGEPPTTVALRYIKFGLQVEAENL